MIERDLTHLNDLQVVSTRRGAHSDNYPARTRSAPRPASAAAVVKALVKNDLIQPTR
jgi:hypothetical protein